LFDLAGYARRPVWPDAGRHSYPCTPPELFAVGAAGVDGIHDGFVVHAPELPANDYPLAVLNPMSASDGIRALGATAREGLSRLVASALEDPRREAAARDIASRLGLTPARGPSFGVYSPALPALEPVVPAGWRHETSTDGVGVLAPVEAFRPVAGRAAPATALLRARQALAHHDGSKATAVRAMIDAYRQLGRGLLAEILADHADQHWPGWRDVTAS
jgi:hypothetical protein